MSSGCVLIWSHNWGRICSKITQVVCGCIEGFGFLLMSVVDYLQLLCTREYSQPLDTTLALVPLVPKGHLQLFGIWAFPTWVFTSSINKETLQSDSTSKAESYKMSRNPCSDTPPLCKVSLVRSKLQDLLIPNKRRLKKDMNMRRWRIMGAL